MARKPAPKKAPPTPSRNKPTPPTPSRNKPPPPAKPARKKAAAAPPPKRRDGRPEHVPDISTRGRVIAWVGGGIEQRLIAKALGIAERTLRRRYKGELMIGKAEMDGMAVATLGKAMQRGGKEAVVAAKWWTQSRMGWHEHVIVDDGKPSDTPMRIIVELVGDPAPPRVAAPASTQQRLPPGTVQLVG